MRLLTQSATAALSPSAEAWGTSGTCLWSTAPRTLRGSRCAGLLRKEVRGCCLCSLLGLLLSHGGILS